MVTLDNWDSHLDCAISEDGGEAKCLHENGFQYLWKGARATHGVTNGVYMFEVKVEENLKVCMPETQPHNKNILRVGCSLPMSSLFLGDSADSWGWGGTGKKSNANEFTNYGGTFGEGDVIGVIMDLNQQSVGFMKNGTFMGTAFTNIDPACNTIGLFPHILLKNVRVKVNFGAEEAMFPPPEDMNVTFLDDADENDMVENPVDHPRRLEDAEFFMMVGLPGCGKTYWAIRHMEENPRKNYTLLGTNAVIDQMKVVGLGRRGNYAERWQELITQATPVFNKLCEIAGKTTRHIILDQTNVFGSARARKVSEYKNFGVRRAIVIVNDEDTLNSRTEKRELEEGKFVPVYAVAGMKQSFSKPQFSEGFTNIDYVEVPEKPAEALIRKYNECGNDFQVRDIPQKKGKKRNRGRKPKKPIEQRDASDMTFDRHNFIEKIEIPEVHQQHHLSAPPERTIPLVGPDPKSELKCKKLEVKKLEPIDGEAEVHDSDSSVECVDLCSDGDDEPPPKKVELPRLTAFEGYEGRTAAKPFSASALAASICAQNDRETEGPSSQPSGMGVGGMMRMFRF